MLKIIDILALLSRCCIPLRHWQGKWLNRLMQGGCLVLLLVWPLSSVKAERIGFDNDERFFQVVFRDRYGRRHHLTEYDNKIIILFMFQHDDFASLANLGQLAALQRKVGRRDLVVIPIEMTVDSKGKARDLRKSLSAAGIYGVTIYSDDRGKTAYYLDVRSLPTTVVFDAYGRMVMKIEGFYDWETNTIRQFYWRAPKGKVKKKLW